LFFNPAAVGMNLNVNDEMAEPNLGKMHVKKKEANEI
jgi:hypothetical protein